MFGSIWNVDRGIKNIERRIVVKKFGLLLSAFFLFSLAACQSGSTVTSSTSQNTYNSPNVSISENEPSSSGELDESPEETEPVQRDDADFRNAKWGDSKETVLEYETQIELKEDKDALIGSCRIIDYSATAIYIFDDSDRLVGGSYTFFPDEYKSAGMYISTYQELKEALIKEYGEPTKDVVKALEDQDFIDFVGEEMALEYNGILYEANWETETTNIAITLSAPNYQVGLGILYIDKALYPDTPIESDSGL